MPLAILATAACGVLLLAGPDRRSTRAWIALGVMLAAMLVAVLGSGAQLLAGAVTLLAAPLVVARVPRAAALPALHRAAALLATAACLLGAGHGIPSSHHGGLDLAAPMLFAYLVTAAVAMAHARRRPVVAGEVALMAGGMLAMALLG